MKCCYFFVVVLGLAGFVQGQQDEILLCGCLTEAIRCPLNSNTLGGGAVSLEDCICNYGYLRSHDGSCVEAVYCPGSSSSSSNSSMIIMGDSSTSSWVLSEEDCPCDAGYARQFLNSSCEPILLTPSQNGGLPLELVVGLAAGGGALVVSGAGWALVNFFMFTPKLIPPTIPLPPTSNPAAIQMRNVGSLNARTRFTEYV